MSFFKESYTSFKITYIMSADKCLGSSSKQVEIAELCSISPSTATIYRKVQYVSRKKEQNKTNKQKIPLFSQH